MNNAVLIQQGFGKYECLLDLVEERHARYCKDHDFDYWSLREHELGIRNCWEKVILLRSALEKYKYAVWLDADAFIEDVSVDLRYACKEDMVGAVKFRAPYSWGEHYNVGVVYVCNGKNARSFIDEWKSTHMERASFRKFQNEQGGFNKIANDSVVFELHEKWNHTVGRHFGDKKVVLGYHSVRGVDEKLSAMKKEINNEL